MSEFYNEVEELEAAAFMLLEQKVWDQAAGLFASLVAQQPSNAIAWYGLSNSYFHVSGEQGDINKLKIAYAFGLRSLKEDPTNRYTSELLSILLQKTPLQEIGVNDLSPFSTDPIQITGKLLSSDRLIEVLCSFPDYKERMKLIMFLGDQNFEVFVPLLIYAVEKDENKDVQMSALKRLYPRGNDPAVRAVFERIYSNGKWFGLEPYFTMTLIGMNIEWANEFLRQNPTPFYQQYNADMNIRGI